MGRHNAGMRPMVPVKQEHSPLRGSARKVRARYAVLVTLGLHDAHEVEGDGDLQEPLGRRRLQAAQLQVARQPAPRAPRRLHHSLRVRRTQQAQLAEAGIQLHSERGALLRGHG